MALLLESEVEVELLPMLVLVLVQVLTHSLGEWARQRELPPSLGGTLGTAALPLGVLEEQTSLLVEESAQAEIGSELA